MDERKGIDGFEALRQQWPGVSLGYDELCRHLTHLAAQLGAAEPMPRYLADVYICCACMLKRPGARLALEGRCAADLGALLAGTPGSTRQRELSTRVRHMLFEADPPLVASYSGRAPFGPWLRVCVLRMLRAEERRAAHGSSTTERDVARVVEWLGAAALPPGAPSSRVSRLERLLAGVLAGFALPDLTLLRLHLAHGMRFADLARAHGVPEAALAARFEGYRAHLLGQLDSLAKDPRAAAPCVVADSASNRETWQQAGWREGRVERGLSSAATSGVRRSARDLNADVGARG
jgi:hypothetical protein